MKKNPAYVLITPAWNEEHHIEKTIQSVLNQTILPEQWVIVSDASTDRTDEIVGAYAGRYGWIKFIRKLKTNDYYFASQVNTLNVGYEQLLNLQYDFIGELDGDIFLPPNYYETILAKFAQNPNLGVAGGEVIDYYNNKTYHFHSHKESVAGAIFLFRRKCFEEIIPFVETKEGGFDAIAVIKARMKGWETKTFSDIIVHHLKPRNVSSGSMLKGKWQVGKRDYFLGTHPLFECAKCCFRILEQPYLIGSIIRLTSYLFLWLQGTNVEVSDDIVQFIRKEQLNRLFRLFKGRKQ